MRHILLGLGMAVTLSACGDPLRNVARLGDVTTTDGTAAVAEAPSQARAQEGGLFARLMNREPDDPTNAAVEAALADASALGEDEAASRDSQEAPTAAEPEAETQRAGLFGLFRRNQDDAEADEVVEPAVASDSEIEPTLASVTVAEPAPETEPAPRRGLAGIFRRNPDRGALPRNGPDSADVAAGAVLPFGEIARVCGLRANELGTQIDNTSGYRIFDTIPSSTAPRPFYITGFSDNCARTFTGAVVVTGDVETHEFVRYQPSNERIDYTTTDNAYEALKASFCRVGRGQPCGDRTNRLDRNTQFITVYNFFGGTFSSVPTQWAQILVHDGEVLAISIKDGQ